MVTSVKNHNKKDNIEGTTALMNFTGQITDKERQVHSAASGL